MKQSTAIIEKTGFLLPLLLVLSVCATRLPEPSVPQSNITAPPEISINPDTGEHSTEIDVLIYNIAALPWPLRSNRAKATKLIGAELAAMRKRGEQPNIVMIQEGFRSSIKRMIELSGYPNWVRGPKASDKMPDFSDRAPEDFKKGRSFFKGERIGKIMDSGLYILSDWPILGKTSQPFYRYECAGFDCGANKGMLAVGIQVPGMPGFLQMFTIHMNAGGTTTGVSEERSLTAHSLQIDHLNETMKEGVDVEQPLIFGGDFNMKQARERMGYVERDREQVEDIKLVQHYCVVIVPSECDVRMEYESSEPWLETQDWQAWRSGKQVKVKAILVDNMFEEERSDAPKIKGRRTLSDHNGLLVRYRLSWKPLVSNN